MSTTTPLRIDIVSDVVCPWCIIGFKRLEQALAALPEGVETEIHWHPFELNPQMGADGQNLREHLGEKYGTTLEGSIQARKRLTDLGDDLGFAFDYFDDMKMFNTFKAHQLLHHAREHGKEQALKLRLFSAFFSERKNVDDEGVLIAEAVAVGLDADEAAAVLADGRHADAVRTEERSWMERGVRSVPTFVFDQRYAVMGAQEPAVLQDVMQKTLAAR